MVIPTVQIGGKFSRSENGIFVLKQRLVAAGIAVSHPIGNRIETIASGMSLSVDLDALGISLFDLEIEYFRRISRSSLHIVHNKLGGDLGYVGESGATEMSYAMLKNKNICVLYEPVYSRTVPQALLKILETRALQISVERLDFLEGVGLREKIIALSGNRDYNLHEDERRLIKKYVSMALRKYYKLSRSLREQGD